MFLIRFSLFKINYEYMIKGSKILMLLFCLQIFINTYAQNDNIWGSKRYDNWIFAFRGWLNFSTGTPIQQDYTQIPITYNNNIEGTASISDKYGRLLFYTNGVAVWNACNDSMPNGNNLLGSISS